MMHHRHFFTTTIYSLILLLGKTGAQGVGDQDRFINSDGERQPGDPNRYIVEVPKNKRHNFFDSIKSKALDVGAKLEVEVRKKGVLAFTFPDAESIALVQKLASSEGIIMDVDQPRYLVGLNESTTTKLRGRKLEETIPWGIQRIYEGNGIPDASYFDGADDHKICIIDSGYVIDHEDLPSDASSVNGGSYGDSNKCSFHGSHVAGTIGAIGENNVGVIGVYPGAPNMKIAKVFKPIFLLGCAFIYSSGLIGAVQDCVDSGASIVSMSLGGPDFIQAEAAAFAEFFTDDNLLSVAAAGNDGPDTVGYPAAYPSVLSVAAIDEDDNIAYFSSTNDYVDIAAPGVNVLSTIGPNSDYAYYSGTSMACPHASGAALVLWNKFPACSNQAIRNALEQSAVDLGAPGTDPEFGNGRLSYWNAVDYLDDNPCSDSPPCVDNPGSYQGYTCAWVAESPSSRCGFTLGNISASEECQVTCNTCP